jgi:hypothetical protein
MAGDWSGWQWATTAWDKIETVWTRLSVQSEAINSDIRSYAVTCVIRQRCRQVAL